MPSQRQPRGSEPGGAPRCSAPMRRARARCSADGFEPRGKRGRVQGLVARVTNTGQATSVLGSLAVGAEQRCASRRRCSARRSRRTCWCASRPPMARREPLPRATAQSALLRLIESAPDAFVVTDLDGRRPDARTAPSSTWRSSTTEAQVLGQSLEQLAGPHRCRPERADHQPAPARRRCACSRP